MKNPFYTRINQWTVFFLFTIITIIILLASVFLFNYLKKEEIKRINLLSMAIKMQQDIEAPAPNVLEILQEINESNHSIPVVLLNQNNQLIIHRNLPKKLNNNEQKIVNYALEMGNTYPPIEIKIPDGSKQYVYYENSRLLKNLQYSPYFLGIFIFLFFLFSYWFLQTIKKTDEGILWAGLAKETAHQIGTPLSSMIGWLEIMRLKNNNDSEINELEKDIYRLKTISERFSKIGSKPELKNEDLIATLQENYEYLKNRISSQVEFQFESKTSNLVVPHNKILLSWVVENLVKNAVDAMKGSGKLKITITEKEKIVWIDFKDSGIGMTAGQAKKVFSPGYSTKKRGWGLGLSLAKRVVNEYHNGEIKIIQTDMGKGSTFRIILRK